MLFQFCGYTENHWIVHFFKNGRIRLAQVTSYLSCCCLVTKSCLTLCNPTDCRPPGSFIQGILQVRILGWVAISFSRGSSWPRDWTHISCIGRQILYHWATCRSLANSSMTFILSLLSCEMERCLTSMSLERWCLFMAAKHLAQGLAHLNDSVRRDVINKTPNFNKEEMCLFFFLPCWDWIRRHKGASWGYRHVIDREFSLMICVQQNLPFLSLFLVRKVEAELSPVRFVRPQDPAGAGRQVQHVSAVLVSVLQGACKGGVNCLLIFPFSLMIKLSSRERAETSTSVLCTLGPNCQLWIFRSIKKSFSTRNSGFWLLPGDENYTLFE